jgi:hypothetical protein
MAAPPSAHLPLQTLPALCRDIHLLLALYPAALDDLVGTRFAIQPFESCSLHALEPLEAQVPRAGADLQCATLGNPMFEQISRLDPALSLSRLCI